MTAPLAVDRIPGVWRGTAKARVEAISTGFEGLDGLLPGGGWPVGAVSEILHAAPGVGELRLVLPLVAHLTQAGGRVAMSAPPHIPFAAALVQAGVMLPRLIVTQPPENRETLWGIEQMLRSGVCSAVISWVADASDHELRRLQLAAETGRAIGILMRPAGAESQISHAALRLVVGATPRGDAFKVTLSKVRGGTSGLSWTSA